jgi:chromate transporter
MRQQWVDTGVLEADEFNDAFASVSLLPGPASTQMALWLGWRLHRYLGLLVAGALFITPAVILVIVASHFVLSTSRPLYLLAAALGAGAVVPAIALRAATDLTRGYQISKMTRSRQVRVGLYGSLGIVSCLFATAWLPVAMIAVGVVELTVQRPRHGSYSATSLTLASKAVPLKAALAWMAFKIGALSFGGGFVIVPLMRADAVATHHWMSSASFLSAVAIGQLTPGPVVATVAGVGYAAGGLSGALLASAVAFAPSLLFVGVGARHLGALRQHRTARAFLDGAGPVATGAIVGAAILLARSCTLAWQWPVLALATALVVIWRRSATWALVAGALGAIVLEALFHVAV